LSNGKTSKLLSENFGVITVTDIFFCVFSLNQGSTILWVSSLQHTRPSRKALPSKAHPRGGSWPPDTEHVHGTCWNTTG